MKGAVICLPDLPLLRDASGESPTRILLYWELLLEHAGVGAMAQRVNCEGLPPTRPSKTDLLWDAISRRPSSVSPFKVCISCTKRPPLPLDTEKARGGKTWPAGPTTGCVWQPGVDGPTYLLSQLVKEESKVSLGIIRVLSEAPR
ncbi:unnamed protein product [Rangifer tarandus platyrhynchus]|uniref:Uncharacterized protein n=2 Tax=Rangifer tarandus platyrhynchus TaxID=3082113 RepID=A0AC59ZD26_RANTA|nr:unnamed protein product [Rangifer tarandus platyrhynchus]